MFEGYEGINVPALAIPDFNAMLMPTYNSSSFMAQPGGGVGDWYSQYGGLNANPAGSGGIGGGGFGASLGGPLGIASLGLSALSSLGSLWMGLKAQKLAKKQFKFTKDITNTNLANSIQSYNTALADRARARGVMESQSPEQVQAYIDANSLSRSSGKTGPTPVSRISGAALGNYSSLVNNGYNTSSPTGPGRSSSSSTPSSTTDDDQD